MVPGSLRPGVLGYEGIEGSERKELELEGVWRGRSVSMGCGGCTGRRRRDHQGSGTVGILL